MNFEDDDASVCPDCGLNDEEEFYCGSCGNYVTSTYNDNCCNCGSTLRDSNCYCNED